MSGLLSSSRTVLAVTRSPGSTGFRSTRPGVTAETQRICSGIRLPGPRTSRTIGPSLTVSVHTVPRSTLGAAGRSRERPTVTASRAMTPPPI